MLGDAFQPVPARQNVAATVNDPAWLIGAAGLIDPAQRDLAELAVR